MAEINNNKISAEDLEFEINLDTEKKYINLENDFSNENLKNISTETVEIEKILVTEEKKNEENSIEVVSWSELLQYRNKLVSEEKIKEVDELDKKIIIRTKDYNDGSVCLLNPCDYYSFREILKDIDVHSETSEGFTILVAIEKLNEEINFFEKYFGINSECLISSENILKNIEVLKNMPSDDELFIKEIPQYKRSEMKSKTDVLAVLRDDPRDLPLDVLSGCLQCEDLDKDQYKKLEEIAFKKVKNIRRRDFLVRIDSKECNAIKIADFEYLLNVVSKVKPKYFDFNLKELSVFIKNKSKLLSNVKNDFVASIPYKYEQLGKIEDVLDLITFTGNLKLFGRERFSGTSDEKMKNLFKEQVRIETIMYLANVMKDEISEEIFKEEYINRLQISILKLVFGDSFIKYGCGKDVIEKVFHKLYHANNNIEIARVSLSGFHVASVCGLVAVNERLNLNEKYVAVVKEYKNNVDAICNECEKIHGSGYNLGLICIMHFGWGASYQLGFMTGTWCAAAVGCISLSSLLYKLYGDFKNQKKKIEIKWQKLTFNDYIKRDESCMLECCLYGFGVAYKFLIGIFENIDKFIEIRKTLTVNSGFILFITQVIYATRKASKGKKIKVCFSTAITFILSGLSLIFSTISLGHIFGFTGVDGQLRKQLNKMKKNN